MNIIKSNEEISHIFSHGTRYKTRDIVFIVLRKDEQHGQLGRVAFIAGKKLGNAVWRNRAKRRMRSVYRDLEGLFREFDVLLVARQPIADSAYPEMLERSRRTIEKIEKDRERKI